MRSVIISTNISDIFFFRQKGRWEIGDEYYLDANTTADAQLFRDECRLGVWTDFDAMFPCTRNKP